jgi:hypothetical protein
MVGRSIGSGVQSAVGAAHVEHFPLVELGLDAGTLYLCGAAFDVPYAGHTYQSVLGVGQMETIEETDDGVMGLAFTLSHVQSSSISLALGTEVQGRSCLVRMAFLDSSGTLQVDDNVWTGLLDQITIEDDSPSGRLRVTAEHVLVRWDTPRPVRFSDEDQRVISGTDGFFKNTASIVETTLVWPDKAFFQQ